MIVTSATSQIFYKKTLTAHKCGMTLPPKNIVFHHILGKTISKQREFVAKYFIFRKLCNLFAIFCPPPKKKHYSENYISHNNLLKWWHLKYSFT
jgi:hypothetical protein